MANPAGTILALDVGEARIGLALAHMPARLALPYMTLVNGPDITSKLRQVCAQEDVTHLVIGLPRGLNGQDTEQTAKAKSFGERLRRDVGLPITWQDEAVTSIHAEDELRARGKAYNKGDIDALAATYILEDFLRENV